MDIKKIVLILFFTVIFSCFSLSVFEDKLQPLVSCTPNRYLWAITYESRENDYDGDGVYDVFTNITAKNGTEVDIYVNKTTMSLNYKWNSMVCNLTNVSFIKMQEYNLTTSVWESVETLNYVDKPASFPLSWCPKGYVLFENQTVDRKYKLIFPAGSKAIRIYTGNSSEAGVLNSSGYIDYRTTEFNNSKKAFNITFSSKGSYTEVGIKVPENATINYAVFNITGLQGGWYNELAENVDGHRVGEYNSIDVDSSNKPHISHYDGTSYDLRYCNKTGSTWSCEQVDTTGYVGKYSSIGIDSNGKPHIAYWDYDSLDYSESKIKYCNKTGSTWSCEEVHTAGADEVGISIDLDTNNKPHIITSDDEYAGMTYGNKTGPTWSFDENVDYSGDDRYNSLALDTNNKPHISYYTKSGYNLRYCNKTGSTWSCEDVATTGDVGKHSSIAIDTNNKAHIAFEDSTNKEVRYCNKTGSTWSCEKVEEENPDDIFLDLDSQNNPKIVYIHGINNTLKYCEKSAGSWSCKTIDDTSYVNGWTSLKLDSNDIPHISYYDTTGGDLRYASKTKNMTNLTIKLNGTSIFNQTGSFATNNRTIDFTSILQNCIENQSGDSKGYVTCALNFSSGSSGKLEVHDFLLNFTSDVSTAFNIIDWWDKVKDIFEGQLYNYSTRYTTSSYSPFTDLNISGIYINSSATECKIDGSSKSYKTQGGKKYCPIEPPETILRGGGGTWKNHTVWDDKMGEGYPIKQSNGTLTHNSNNEREWFKYVNITSFLSDGTESSGTSNESFYNVTFQLTFEEDSLTRGFNHQGVRVLINTLWQDLNTSNKCYNAYKSTETNYSSSVLNGERWWACYDDRDYDGFYDYYKVRVPHMSKQQFKAFVNGTKPSITITDPVNDSWYPSKTKNLNWSTTGTKDKCWYSLNNGANTTVICTDEHITINAIEGKNNITMWTNNSYGVNHSDLIAFTVDSQAPNINFTYPTASNNSYFNRNYIEVNVSVNDTNFKNITFFLFNSTQLFNQTSFTAVHNFMNYTYLNPNEYYYYNVTVFDNASNFNKTETRKITLDSTNPTINITSPYNGSTYHRLNVTFTWNFTEANPDQCWFELNSNSNTTVNCTSYKKNIGLQDEAWNNLTLWINDTLNRINLSSISFFVNSTIIKNISMMPYHYPVYTTDTLNCSVFINSPYSSVNVSFKFYNDTAHMTQFDNNVTCYGGSYCYSSKNISPSYTKHFENYTCSARAKLYDWFANWRNSSELFINNSIPTISSASINNTSPTDADALKCLNGTINDYDNDSLTKFFDWEKDNVWQGINNQVLEAGNTSSGETWRCRIWVSDFYSNSTNVTSGSVSIGTSNYPPSINYTNATTENTSVRSSIANPTNNNSWINLSVDYYDKNSGNAWTAYFCKSNNANPSGCDDGSWASSSANITSNPITARLNASGISTSVNYYYVFIVDNTSLMSGGTKGNFSVNHPPSRPSNPSPSNNSYLAHDYALLSAKSSDTDSDKVNYTFYNSTALMDYNAINYNWTSLQDGSYYWLLHGIDEHGYNGSNSSIYKFTIDTVYPSVAITSPVNGSAYNSLSVDLAYTAEDKNRDQCFYSVYYTATGSTHTGNTTLPNCEGTTITLTAYAEYTLKHFVNDSAGNMQMTTVTFKIQKSGGGGKGGGAAGGEEAPSINLSSLNITKCGDGICEKGESPWTCPEDCVVNPERFFSMEMWKEAWFATFSFYAVISFFILVIVFKNPTVKMYIRKFKRRFF